MLESLISNTERNIINSLKWMLKSNDPELNSDLFKNKDFLNDLNYLFNVNPKSDSFNSIKLVLNNYHLLSINPNNPHVHDYYSSIVESIFDLLVRVRFIFKNQNGLSSLLKDVSEKLYYIDDTIPYKKAKTLAIYLGKKLYDSYKSVDSKSIHADADEAVRFLKLSALYDSFQKEVHSLDVDDFNPEFVLLDLFLKNPKYNLNDFNPYSQHKTL